VDFLINREEEEKMEKVMLLMLKKLASLRQKEADIKVEIEGVKSELHAVMEAQGIDILAKDGVGTVTVIPTTETVSLNKEKLRENLLKYLSAEEVADVIERSSTFSQRKAYLQFSRPK
jgi:hypothetical protein